MNKKVALLSIFSLFLLSTLAFNMAHATTDTIGGTSGGGDWVGGAGVYKEWGQPVVASSSGTLQTIGVNLQSYSSGTISVAIYSDVSSCQSGGLLSNSIITTPSGTGWIDITAQNTITINSGTTYCLVFTGVGGGSIAEYFVSSGAMPTSADITNVYNWENPFSLSSTINEELNMRMTYASSSTTTTSTTTTSTSTSITTTTSSTSTSSSTSSSSSSTSSSTSTSINTYGLNQTGLVESWALIFNVPYAYIGLEILAFGIAIFTSKRISIAMWSAALVSFILLKINPNFLAVSATITILAMIITIVELFIRHKK